MVLFLPFPKLRRIGICFMSGEITFDVRDSQFVLFEHQRVQQLFELPRFAEFEVNDFEMMISEARRFAKNVLAPTNRPGDVEGCTWEEGHVKVPKPFHDVYRRMYDDGWMKMATDVEYGGMGLPLPLGAALGELFVGANCSLVMLAGLTRAAAALLIEYGSDEMKELYLPNLVEGRWQGTMCLTEAQAGSAVGSLTTAAVMRDGQYYVRGQKIFISGGEHDMTENIIHLVLARCENAPPGIKGVSLFLVPKLCIDDQGNATIPNDVTCLGIEEKLGLHGSPTCAMSFGDNDQCLGYLIGEEHKGIEYMFHMMNSARIGVGIQGVGLASCAYQSALQYAQERVQGVDMKNFRDPLAPSVLITEHPDVRRMLTTMKAYVEGCRAMLVHAALCVDLAEHSPEEAIREKMLGRAELLTPVCKAYCSDIGFEVSTTAIQVLGGHGYLRDYPIEQLLRDSKIGSIYEGTNGIQAIDLVGRKIGRKQGMTFMEFMGDLGEVIDKHADHPTLSAAFARFKHHKEQLEATTMSFAGMQMSGDLDYPLLSATPYLRMLGNLIVGWLLLEQAVVADAALEEIYASSAAADDAAKAALRRGQDDAKFYFNKLKTAEFFVSNLLTQNEHLAAAIESNDHSALEAIYN